MPYATVIYCRSATLGGVLIRFRDPFGRWSHCGMATNDGTVLEARSFKGVVETPNDEFMARYPGVNQSAITSIECPDPGAAISWFRSQLGKGYDYRSILGLALRQSWQDDDRWNCSEIVETALARGGCSRFRDGPRFISPNMSYQVR